MLSHKSGDLFSAPKEVVLAHACNAKGVWGSGVAAQFRLLFPKAYQDYKYACTGPFREYGSLVGDALLIRTPNYTIGCLITSDGYGTSKDPESKILESTDTAVLMILHKMFSAGLTEIHTPKINSGLFGVPWDKTEKIILRQLERFPNINWTVWTPSK